MSRLQTSYSDNTGLTRALYTADPETTGFGGDRLRFSLEFTPTSSRQSAVERATIRSFLASLRGRQNRAYLWDPSYQGPRGSFSAPELLSNNTFANGTTGWSVANGTLTVADRVGRVTAASAGEVDLFQSVALTQYAPHALRSMILDGAQSAGLSIGPSINSGGVASVDYQTARGLRTAVLVAPSASAANQFALVINALTGFTAGTYVEVPWCSLSRCALVDNGANLLLRSDELNTGWTLGDVTIGANATAAPDGTATGDEIEETTANAAHFITQGFSVGSAAADYAFACALKSNGRQWGYIRISEGISGTQLYQTFDLTNGQLGSTSFVGANWSNLRVFISPRGAGWYYCCIVGRKTNAATGLTAWIGPSSGDNVNSYAGTAGLGIRAWRATLAQSSVPTRLVQTTTTASAGTSQTGSALYVKGLPASASGLLLPDDRFEVITSRGSELKIVTASLDSDAAGLGYLQFSPPLRGIPADNAPIIVNTPMARAIFVGDMVGWSDEPAFSSASAEFEEA